MDFMQEREGNEIRFMIMIVSLTSVFGSMF